MTESRTAKRDAALNRIDELLYGQRNSNLDDKQTKFDADEFHMFNITTGLRYCDTMTKEQFDKMLKNREREHG